MESSLISSVQEKWKKEQESRIPIPTRLADIETHKLRKEFLQKNNKIS